MYVYGPNRKKRTKKERQHQQDEAKSRVKKGSKIGKREIEKKKAREGIEREKARGRERQQLHHPPSSPLLPSNSRSPNLSPPPMDHHHHHLPPPPPRSPMENSASSKPPTPASTPSSRLAAAPSSRVSSAAPHPSPSSSAPTPASRTVYSDRFIPSRAGSNLALFDLAPSPSHHDAAAAAASPGAPPPSGSTPASSPYCALLRAALFGPTTPDRVASSASACSSSSSAGASPVGSPATGNIFRFKAEVPRNAKRALFSDGDDEGVLFPGVFTTRGTGPRKIPRSPYKVRSVRLRFHSFFQLIWSVSWLMFLWIEKNMVFIIHLLCTKNPVLFVMHKETDMKAYYSKSHMNFPSVALRCWMLPHCRMTSTWTLWIGLRIISLQLDWGIVSTYGMHAAARWANCGHPCAFLFGYLKRVCKEVYCCAGHQAMWFGGGWQCLFSGLGTAWHSPCCRDKPRQSSG